MRVCPGTATAYTHGWERDKELTGAQWPIPLPNRWAREPCLPPGVSARVEGTRGVLLMEVV